MKPSPGNHHQFLPDTRAMAQRRSRRMLKDRLARIGVALGGLSVIGAITLIFFYLAYVVVPLFQSADVQPVSSYDTPGGSEQATLHWAMEEQAEIGVRYMADGEILFFYTHSGEVIKRVKPPIDHDVQVRSFAAARSSSGMVAFGLSNGQVLVTRAQFKTSFPNNKRLITPEVDFPLGEQPIVIEGVNGAIKQLAVQSDDAKSSIVVETEDDRLMLVSLAKETNFLDDSITLEQSVTELPKPSGTIEYLVINPEQDTLYIVDQTAKASYLNIANPEDPRVLQQLQLVPEGLKVTALAPLSGGISLLVGQSDGRIVQWFPVRDPRNNYTLQRVREFEDQTTAIQAIAPEYFRKGFIAADSSGRLGIYNATAERTLLLENISRHSISKMAISPRADAVLVEDQDHRLHFNHIENEHPEVSWSSLWGKVWYEGYDKPQYIWQSSAATETFEPKFSLVPIAFGTLKAAFYAMIVAIPLAVMGAIFTAHFMSPRMRTSVKPAIEIMEALPTVILGFLAGLWLAPFVEDNLPGIFSLLILLPIGILLASFLWTRLPKQFTGRIPEGWEAALLLPVILVLTFFSIELSPILEDTFFKGNVRLWLTNDMEIPFDQRNSIVVGLAMGFAVIPTIFSIAEDAIFGVPKHLSNGSLALGATPWQTLWRVVLLTASPGIFSAVMIGMGRAVGETMIVLMATGNTPVMDMSIFQGLRTLSANIAVEMPESEVNSTHFRVLFLAGLVLFMFTFMFNTLAEVVRQRLRKKYSSL